jgi:hypothetical protein
MSRTDGFTRSWIIETALPIIAPYNPGQLTIRGLHYQLVGQDEHVMRSKIHKKYISITLKDKFSLS